MCWGRGPRGEGTATACPLGAKSTVQWPPLEGSLCTEDVKEGVTLEVWLPPPSAAAQPSEASLGGSAHPGLCGVHRVPCPVSEGPTPPACMWASQRGRGHTWPGFQAFIQLLPCASSCFLSEAHTMGRPQWAELWGPRRCKHRAGLGQPPPPSIHSMRSLETLPVLCSEAESGRPTQSWLLLTPGCLYPLADDGGLQLSCLNHRNRIFGVGGSEVEVVRAPLDGDGND